MSRIGFADNEESVEEVRKINGLENVRIEGMFTHFARADEKTKHRPKSSSGGILTFQSFLKRRV